MLILILYKSQCCKRYIPIDMRKTTFSKINIFYNTHIFKWKMNSRKGVKQWVAHIETKCFEGSIHYFLKRFSSKYLQHVVPLRLRQSFHFHSSPIPSTLLYMFEYAIVSPNPPLFPN